MAVLAAQPSWEADFRLSWEASNHCRGMEGRKQGVHSQLVYLNPVRSTDYGAGNFLVLCDNYPKDLPVASYRP